MDSCGHKQGASDRLQYQADIAKAALDAAQQDLQAARQAERSSREDVTAAKGEVQSVYQSVAKQQAEQDKSIASLQLARAAIQALHQQEGDMERSCSMHRAQVAVAQEALEQAQQARKLSDQSKASGTSLDAAIHNLMLASSEGMLLVSVQAEW